MLRKEKEQEIKKNREKSLQAERERFARLKELHGSSYAELRESQLVFKSLNQEEEEKRKQEEKKRTEKMTSYAKYVKEMYWPKVSEAKKQELQQIRAELSARNSVSQSYSFQKGETASILNQKSKHRQDRSGMITARNQIENSLQNLKDEAKSSEGVQRKNIKLNWNTKPQKSKINSEHQANLHVKSTGNEYLRQLKN